MNKINFNLLLTALLAGNPSFAEEVDDIVHIAVPSWDAGGIIAHNIGKTLTEDFNIEVSYVEIEGDIIWEQLHNDDGSIDIFPDIWLPNQVDFFDDFVNQRGTVGSNAVPYQGDQGFYVQYPGGIDEVSIADLQDANFAVKFDSDGNGKGEYWPGAEGWHSTLFSYVKMKDYELNGNWEEIQANNATFLDLLEERNSKGVASLFYYWTPDAVHAKYDLVQVSEPDYSEGCRTFIEPSEDSDWLEKSSFQCAYPVSTVYILFRDEFNSSPAVADYLSSYQVDVDQLKVAMFQVKEETHSIAEAAQMMGQ